MVCPFSGSLCLFSGFGKKVGIIKNPYAIIVVIEHNLDVMKQADYLIDVGPDGGTAGGEIVFTGTPREMIESSQTITAEYLRKSLC